MCLSNYVTYLDHTQIKGLYYLYKAFNEIDIDFIRYKQIMFLNSPILNKEEVRIKNKVNKYLKYLRGKSLNKIKIGPVTLEDFIINNKEEKLKKSLCTLYELCIQNNIKISAVLDYFKIFCTNVGYYPIKFDRLNSIKLKESNDLVKTYLELFKHQKLFKKKYVDELVELTQDDVINAFKSFNYSKTSSIDHVFLYGSFYDGTYTKYSDIDIAILYKDDFSSEDFIKDTKILSTYIKRKLKRLVDVKEIFRNELDYYESYSIEIS